MPENGNEKSPLETGGTVPMSPEQKSPAPPIDKVEELDRRIMALGRTLENMNAALKGLTNIVAMTTELISNLHPESALAANLKSNFIFPTENPKVPG